MKDGVKTALAVLLCLCVSGFLWYWTATQLNSVQQHQNDALHAIMCYTEKRVKESKQLPPKQKKQVVKFYDSALKQAHLANCSVKPYIIKH